MARHEADTTAESGTGALGDHGWIGVSIAGHLVHGADVRADTRVAVQRTVDCSDGPGQRVEFGAVEFGSGDGASTVLLWSDDLPALWHRVGALLAEVGYDLSRGGQ